MGVLVEKNAFVDNGDGTVTFPQGLVITDDSEQRNGTKYDIKSMDLSEYGGQVTADHMDMLDRVIAGVDGVKKVGNKVIVKKLNYLVKENPLAQLAYNLLISNKVPTNFSIETYGPWPDEEDRIYYNAKLVGLSQVVIGNNKNAKVNAIIQNSIEQSKENGLDTTELEEQLISEKEITIDVAHKSEEKVSDHNNNSNKEATDMTFVTIKNSREFAVTVKHKNAAGDEVETRIKAGGTLDVSDDQQEAVENQVKNAEAPQKKEEKPAAKKDDDKKSEQTLAEAVAEAMKPMQDKLTQMEQNQFDAKAAVPEFKKALDKENNEFRGTKKEEYAAMDWQDRHAKQINAAWDLLKRHDNSAIEVLNDLNEVNLAALKKENIVKNSVSIADFGNFVISPELLSEIQGFRNDYTALINATSWKETLSTQMAWLLRSGDISMDEVGFLDDTDNLKPISEYSAEIKTSDLMELAAVTPVCNAATRFLAADLLGDVAAGYRNDYDRKRAQLVVARIQQALNTTGNTVPYGVTADVDGITALLDAYKKISNTTPNGTFVMNSQSHATIMGFALRAGISGPLANIFVNGDVPTMFGRPYIIVSDDLMPSVDTAETKSFTVEGSTVTVTAAIFYGDLSKFTGRTSGGLNYDLSTEAAYEVDGTVKSAYQRNELVLRGSFFRGGAILDPARFAGILAPGVS